MNMMGHCNFEMVPNKLFSIFPPLKFLMYTPTTTDESTDTLHEASLKRLEDSPDVVHLTHLTTPDSMYHQRLGFLSVSSKPHMSKWYLLLMWPFTRFFMAMISICGRTFVSERNIFQNLKLQLWTLPIYNRQYLLGWKRKAINHLIEEAILDAEARGTKVLTLGLMNQASMVSWGGIGRRRTRQGSKGNNIHSILNFSSKKD
ncbi:hypothetical protein LguiB_005353 [Lonicera macranthoides]